MDNHSSRKRRSRRNRYRMRLDLLDAVRDVLKEQGFLNLNINNVAKQADVDRNAIYRHFGSFDNLLSHYIESKDFWLESLEKVKDVKIEDHKAFIKQILTNQYETLNNNVELQQLVVWELSELSLRTKTIAQRREILSEKLIRQFEDHFKGENQPDINVISAIMIAGIYYLVVHKRHSTFCLVDFVKEKERVLKGIDQWIDILFEARENKTKEEQIALRALEKGLDHELIAGITGLSKEQVLKLANT